MGHLSQATLLLISFLVLTLGQDLNVCEYILSSPSLHQSGPLQVRD